MACRSTHRFRHLPTGSRRSLATRKSPSGTIELVLTYCFGGANSFEFVTVPTFPPRESSSKLGAMNLDFLVVYDVQHRPTLMAQIKDDFYASMADIRSEVDVEMGQWYNYMSRDCALPRLWGLSLLGTSLRVYQGDTATGELHPLFQGRANPGHILPRNFLEGAWNIDIISQGGFNKMKEIVGDILGNAEA